MPSIYQNANRSELLELLWRMRTSEPKRSLSSILKELRLSRQLATKQIKKGNN